MRKLSHAAAALALVVLAAMTLGVARADAGLLGCNYPTVTQPFLPWGDSTHYYLDPGGSFEGVNTLWKLTGGASTVAGNESFMVNGASDSKSLLLPPGASATGPYSCITGTDLKVRMFAKSSNGSPLRVDVAVPGLLGLVQVVTSFSVPTTTTWQPTVAVVNLANLLSLTSLSSSNIALRVSSTGGATAQVDDVYIDPSWDY